MPRPVSTLVTFDTNWNGTEAPPSAPKCTSEESEPAEPEKVVADDGSLPVPFGSVAPVRPPSLTVPVRPVAPATSTGVSSVMVSCSVLACSVVALPSKSTAWTRPERSMIFTPLSSIGASSATLNEPSAATVTVNTSVLPAKAASVSLVPVCVTVAVSTAMPCDETPNPASTVLASDTNWNGVAFGPSAPKCTSKSSAPGPVFADVTAAGALPLP